MDHLLQFGAERSEAVVRPFEIGQYVQKQERIKLQHHG